MIHHLNDEQINVYCLGELLQNFALWMSLPSDVHELVLQLNSLCGEYIDSYPYDEEFEGEVD